MGKESIGRLGSMTRVYKIEYVAKMAREDPRSSERKELFRSPPQYNPGR